MTYEDAYLVRVSVDILVKPQARLFYNIYAALTIVVYSITINYPGMTMLQVRYIL